MKQNILILFQNVKKRSWKSERSKGFYWIQYSNNTQNVCKNIEEYNPCRKCYVFDDMIADMISNKGLSPIVTELFIRGRKLNVSSVFITQSYLQVPKDLKLIFTHFFVIKIQNKQELQQIAFNHFADIGFEDFMNLSKKCTAKPYSF